MSTEVLEEQERVSEQPVNSADDGRRPARVRRLTSQDMVVAALTGVLAFLVYFRTLGVSIVWGDSAELVASAFQAGVPHPTGYPLYMMLGYAFTHLVPLGSVAYRMNLLSALFATLAVALIYLLMRQVTRSRIASFITALMFAYSQTFWSQAVIAEVYALHMLFVAAVLVCVLTWEATGSRRWLFISAFVYGLGFTHHLMSALLAPGLLLLALTSRHRPQFLRELRYTLPLFLLPLVIYAYLPLAAMRDPDMNWGDPRTWKNFVAHATGRQYRMAMFTLPRDKFLLHVQQYTGLGAKDSVGFLATQFSLGFLWLAPLGAWSLARRNARLFGLTFLVYLVTVIYALNYYIYDIEIYYLPSHLMVGVWIACGIRQLGIWLGRLWRSIALAPAKRRALNPVLGSALLIMPLTLLSVNWSVNDHHDDWSAVMYARAALAALKPNAVLMSGGDNYYFPVMYTRFVEKRRPDVTLMSYYDTMRPERTRLTTRLTTEGLRVNVPDCWYRGHVGVRNHNCLLKHVVDENVGHRPVYILGPPESLRVPWLAQILAPYYRILDSNVPCMELTRRPPKLAVADPRPQRPKRAAFGLKRPDGRVENDLELLGCDVKPLQKGGVPWLRVSYYWRINDQDTARPAKVWVLFTDAEGNYRKKSDGSPEFHNIHPLAYGTGQGSQLLPRTLRETFDLYVPPKEWNQQLQMKIAVAIGEKFLPTTSGREPWVALGEVPVAPAAENLLRVAQQ